MNQFPAPAPGRIEYAYRVHPVPRLPSALAAFSLAFLELLDKWNRVHSLTALPPGQREEELVLDSVALLPWLEAVPAGGRVVDFGTGMGIPALVLAAARPEVEVIAVDKSLKKMAFVRQAAAELCLPNLRAMPGRVERMPPLGASLGTAKAVGPLGMLLEWWGRHAAPGASFLALKGPGWEEEAPVPGWDLQPHPYHLPSRGERVVVEARRADPLSG